MYEFGRNSCIFRGFLVKNVTRFDHGFDDTLVAGASTEISRHEFCNPALIRVRILRQQRMGSHDGARRAKPALQSVMFPECFLNCTEILVIRQTFNRNDRPPTRLNRENETGAHCTPVEENGAGTADPMLAPQMRACKPQLIAKAIRQTGPRLDIDLHIYPVDRQSNFHGFHLYRTISASLPAAKRVQEVRHRGSANNSAADVN